MGLKKAVKKYTLSILEGMAKEYDEVSSKIKTLDSTKKKLSEKIKEAAQELGEKDDKGSYYANAGGFVCGKVSARTVSLNTEKALGFLRENGFQSAIMTVETVNEKALEELVKSGKITKKQFEDMTDVKETFKVSVKASESMPDVEETGAVIPMAASRRR